MQSTEDVARVAAALHSTLEETHIAWSLWAVLLRWIHFAAGVVDGGKPSKLSSSFIMLCYVAAPWHAHSPAESASQQDTH